MAFNEAYYQANGQDKDRPALWMYYRLWRRYCSPGSVLEFGCGVGHLSRRLSRSSKVLALEVNPYAREKLKVTAPLAVAIEAIDEVADESVDSIISLHVLEHISDSELSNVGKQFFRILKPGGRLILVMPDFGGRAHEIKGDHWMAFNDPTHINLKGSGEWADLFVRSWGFKLIKSGADGYYDFPYGPFTLGRIFGDIYRVTKTAVQFSIGRILLQPGDGEAVIFVLEK